MFTVFHILHKYHRISKSNIHICFVVCRYALRAQQYGGATDFTAPHHAYAAGGHDNDCDGFLLEPEFHKADGFCDYNIREDGDEQKQVSVVESSFFLKLDITRSSCAKTAEECPV